MTGLLTGVVVVLVVCHTPKTIMNLSESYHLLRYGARISESEEPLWGKIVIKFSHLLLTLSSFTQGNPGSMRNLFKSSMLISLFNIFL